MATFKILRIKETKKGNPSIGVKNCLEYICDEKKTERRRWITGPAGSDPGFIYEEFLANKRRWKKETGTQAFHFIISFPPNESVTVEQALQIAKEYCDELFKGEYLYVACVHTDREHLHIHICADSISMADGHTFHSSRYDIRKRYRPLNDQICESHGLSVIPIDYEKEKLSMTHNDWEELRNQNQIRKSVSWNEIIRDDIQSVIPLSSDYSDFLRHLRDDLHYKVRDGQYLSLTPPGRTKAMRSIRLGPGYSKKELQERLTYKQNAVMPSEPFGYKVYGDPKDVYRSSLPYIHKGSLYSPIQKQFYKKMMRLRHIRYPSFNTGWKYKKDVVQLARITDITTYLFNNDITSMEDVYKRLNQVNQDRGMEASKERKLLKSIYMEYEKLHDPEDILQSADAKDVPLPSEQDVYQIRINSVLYQEMDLRQETYTVRIPGQEMYIRLYSADSRLYNDGKTLSTYVYGDALYQVVDEYGNQLKKLSGDQVKEYFKSREVTKNKSEDKAIKEQSEWTKKSQRH